MSLAPRHLFQPTDSMCPIFLGEGRAILRWDNAAHQGYFDNFPTHQHIGNTTVGSEEMNVAGVLGRVDKIEILVIPAKAGIYEDVHRVIIGLKTPGFRFKTGMTGYLSTRPSPT